MICLGRNKAKKANQCKERTPKCCGSWTAQEFIAYKNGGDNPGWICIGCGDYYVAEGTAEYRKKNDTPTANSGASILTLAESAQSIPRAAQMQLDRMERKLDAILDHFEIDISEVTANPPTAKTTISTWFDEPHPMHLDQIPKQDYEGTVERLFGYSPRLRKKEAEFTGKGDLSASREKNEYLLARSWLRKRGEQIESERQARSAEIDLSAFGF